MNTKQRTSFKIAAILLVAAGVVLPLEDANAHCDSLDGPVVNAARTALEKSDITTILKWVRPTDEAELKETFQHALAVRATGPEAKELADRYFFETLVRVHRAGEGAPYTGLRTKVADAGPAVVGADKALESDSVDGLVKLVTGAAAEGIRKRYSQARELKEHADHNVEAGREYVAAYVDYVHYVEGIYAAATKREGYHGEAEAELSPGRAHAH